MSTKPAGHNRITELFESEELAPYWKPWTIGSGLLQHQAGALRCCLEPVDATSYSDAQITDYQGLPRRKFPWCPPLHLKVRAWMSHSTTRLKGTAGFGFWNEPFVPASRQLPRLPQAVWFFFASTPNNMALAQGIPGHGWKAAVFDATRWQALLLAPLAPIGFLLMRVPVLYRYLWPIGQRAIGVSETILPVDPVEPHVYELEWHPNAVKFRIDGEQVHATPYAPKGPLGFIAWMDNQYAVVTPQGRFKFGLIATPHRQWLSMDQIEIQTL
jgi:hypothetical protein